MLGRGSGSAARGHAAPGRARGRASRKAGGGPVDRRRAPPPACPSGRGRASAGRAGVRRSGCSSHAAHPAHRRARCVATLGEILVDALFERRARRSSARRAISGSRETLVSEPPRAARLARPQAPPSTYPVLEQPFEADDVELLVAHAQDVAWRLRLQPVPSPIPSVAARCRPGALCPPGPVAPPPTVRLTRRSVETTSLACSRSIASNARCLAPPSATWWPPSSTSSGPRIRNSIAPSGRR